MNDPTETNEAKVAARFVKESAEHQINIVLDSGVHRHISFRRPDTGAYAFALTTWPGHLCVSGDMGSYVFARLHDMFEFFRHDRINASYWAEKLQADAPRRGHREFSEDLFKAAILSDLEGWPFENDEQRARSLNALEEEFDGPLGQHFDTTGTAIRGAMDYTCPETGREFSDFWEHQLEDYTFHFLWCLHAIRWGVATYDATKAASQLTPEAPQSIARPLAECDATRAERDADTTRLDWLTQNTNAELTHSGWSDDDDEWQLHTVNGRRNDREWTLRGAGDTPRDAIDAAMRTLALITQETRR